MIPSPGNEPPGRRRGLSFLSSFGKGRRGIVGAIHGSSLLFFYGEIIQGLKDEPFGQRNFIFVISQRSGPGESRIGRLTRQGFRVLLPDQYPFGFFRPPRDSRDSPENQNPLDEPAAVQPEPRRHTRQSKGPRSALHGLYEYPPRPSGPHRYPDRADQLARLQTGCIPGVRFGFLIEFLQGNLPVPFGPDKTHAAPRAIRAGARSEAWTEWQTPIPRIEW